MKKVFSKATIKPAPSPTRFNLLTKGKIVILLFILAAGIGAFLLNRYLGWFTPSPESILQRTFELANEGRYEEATRYLSLGARSAFQKDPELMKTKWQFFTRSQTFKDVKVTDSTSTGKFQTLHFTIRFNDGEKVDSRAHFGLESGSWTFTIQDFEEAMTRNFFDELLLIRFPISLEENFTSVPGTGFKLRIPSGCIFEPVEKEFFHPKHGITIIIESRRDKNFAEVVEFAKSNFKESWTTLLQTKEISDDRWKKIYFEGESINDKNVPWKLMILVMGDETQAAMVSADCPPGKKVYEITLESIMSVKWER